MIKVSKQFLEDFELVTKYFECSDEEIENEKTKVRKNYEELRVSYAEMARLARKINSPSQEESGILVSELTLDKKEEPKPKKQSRRRR